MPDRSQFVRLGLLAGGCLIILVVMAWPALSGYVYVSDDLGWFHLPLRMFFAKCLDLGDDPSWCPNLFCGFYLHGEGQVGLSHPTHFFLYRFFSISTAFNLELLLCYPVTLIGTYFLLRAHRLESEAALVGAFSFTFAGYQILHFRHVNSISILAHLPWLLVSIRNALVGSPQAAVFARLSIGILTSSQLLLGHPQTVWFSMIVESAYVLGLVWRRRCGFTGLACLVAAKGLGILGGAIQWLPTLDSVSGSIRNRSTWESLTVGSLHPLNLIVPLAPYLFSARVYGPEVPGMSSSPATNLQDWRMHEYGMYVGASTPVLLAWLGLRWKNLVVGKALAIWSLLLLFPALVLALGRYTPLYSLVINLPLVSSFRIPARYLLIVHLTLAILVAVAYADLHSFVRRKELPPQRLWNLWIVPGLAILAVLLVPVLTQTGANFLPRVPLGRWYFQLLGVALVLFATLFVVLACYSRRRSLSGLIVLMVCDLGYYGLSYMRDHSLRPIEEFVSQVNIPKGFETQRLYQAGETENSPVGIGGRLSGGYAALVPTRTLPVGHSRTLQLQGVGWKIPGTVHGSAWIPTPAPMPRFRLVSTVVATSDAATTLKMIDLASTAMVEPGRQIAMPSGLAGEARAIIDRPGHLEIQTEAALSRLLVISESYHEGWRAWIDRNPVDLLRVNGDFLGCYVPPGIHRLSIQFSPGIQAIGRAISTVGLMLLIGCSLIEVALLSVRRCRISARSLPTSFVMNRPYASRIRARHVLNEYGLQINQGSDEN